MNQILTDEEICEISIDCASVSPSDIYFARVIEAKILKILNSAEPVAWMEWAEQSEAWFLAYSENPLVTTKPLYEHPPAPSAVEAERDALKNALEKLACLGNGDSYGNSIGNCIAQEALKGLK